MENGINELLDENASDENVTEIEFIADDGDKVFKYKNKRQIKKDVEYLDTASENLKNMLIKFKSTLKRGTHENKN